MLDEHLRHGAAPAQVERGEPLLVAEIEVGALLREVLDDRQLVVHRRDVHARLALRQRAIHQEIDEEMPARRRSGRTVGSTALGLTPPATACRALARSPHEHAPHSATSLLPPSPFAGGGVGSGGENIERKSTASSSR